MWRFGLQGQEGKGGICTVEFRESYFLRPDTSILHNVHIVDV
jgi:hypothetical protein